MKAVIGPRSPRRVKLRPPRLPEDVVLRPRLLGRLNRMAALSLVVAPAGYGKTTLVGTWLAQTDLPSAWLSLDGSDNEPTMFLAQLVVALATIFPDFGGDILEALSSPQSVPFAELAVQLINQLNELSRDFILVLDDYHAIRQPEIHQLLVDLISFPPRALHLVITTRYDPPLPWRVRIRSNLCELRAADLGFTDEEAALFLAKASARPLASAEAYPSIQKAHGWVTSLRLIALATRLHAAQAALPETTNSGTREFTEYFNQEVLADLRPDLLAFLMSTSILDLLNGPLCDFVIGTAPHHSPDADAVPSRSSAELLRELVAIGAFTEALDDEGNWYRYHPLLREVLRRRLAQSTPADKIADLYVRASAWHEDHNLLDEALAYALAGGQVQCAVAIMRRHRQQMLNRWEWRSIERRLQQFPLTAIDSCIELLLARAWSHQWHYDLADIRTDLKRIEVLVAQLSPDDEQLRESQGEVAALRSQQLLVLGDGAGAAAAAQTALANLSPNQFYVRTLAMVYLVLGCQMNGQWQLALAYSTTFAADDGAPRDLVLGRTLTLRAYADLPATNLPASPTPYATMLQIVSAHGLKTNVAWAHYFWAATSYLQNDLHGAEDHFKAAVGLVDNAHAMAYTHSAIGLALTYQALGRPQEALDTIESARKRLAARQQHGLLRCADAFAADLAARQGRIDEALRWVARAGSQFEYDATPMFYVPGLASVRVLLAGGTPGNLLAANAWLQEQAERAQRTHNVYAQIQCHALAAALQDAQGGHAEALATIAQALALAEHGQIVRVFVDLAPQLAPLFAELAADNPAAAFPVRVRNAVLLESEAPATAAPTAAARRADPPAPGHAQRPDSSGGDNPQAAAPPTAGERDLQELLTYREMDVLKLLEQRMTNKEIAHVLGISTETVRQHTVNLFRKLNVANRRQAIVVAYAMGYIGAPGSREGIKT
jgi:LuxR family transcriptional regulator, maltose regulon positive regulatory protein